MLSCKDPDFTCCIDDIILKVFYINSSRVQDPYGQIPRIYGRKSECSEKDSVITTTLLDSSKHLSHCRETEKIIEFVLDELKRVSEPSYKCFLCVLIIALSPDAENTEILKEEVIMLFKYGY